MKITFDAVKNQNNAAKHGVGLEQAAHIEWGSALIWIDERRDYSETRLNAIAYIGLRLYCISFTERVDARRIISLRKANLREVTRYANA